MAQQANNGMAARITQGLSKRSALTFVILLGVVSMFGDIVYEGARSITGPYLAVLGASAAAVGIVAGFGELVGYGLRLVSGYISDRTQRYWPITLLGYGLTVVAVPLLAVAGRWELAALLIILERTGKGIRTPARDAMLSHATTQMGRGWGFGLHEALDQVGATIGAMALMNTFQRYLRPTEAGIIYTTEPVFAAFFAWLVLGQSEALNEWGFLGAALMLVADVLAAVQFGGSKQSHGDASPRPAEARSRRG